MVPTADRQKLMTNDLSSLE